MSTSTYTVGQQVIVRGVGGRVKNVADGVVTKVGRKNVTVRIGGYMEAAFSMRTGFEANSRVASPMRVFTPETLAEDEERTETIRALYRAGISITHSVSHYTLADVKALLAVAEAVRAR